MPSREPELYKDKIEVSLDGRQIFYLFFGGAVIVGMVFVLGVMVGRRVEARGHVDRADLPAASDPLAALDRLERSDHLSFHGALTGSDTPTDVEKAIGELEKRRAAKPAGEAHAAPAAPRPEAAPARAEVRAEVRPEARPEARADGKADAVARPDADKPHVEADKPRADKHDSDKHDSDKHDLDKRDSDKRDSDKRDSDKRDDKKPHKHDDGSAASKGDREARPDHDKKTGSRGDAARSEPHADARGAATEGHADPDPAADRSRFTLQLSSFQDKAEAEAFLSATKAAGFQPYLTEADVTGKGMFYRVRLGSYRSLEAANDAKAEYEKASRKTAQVMRL
ncbi:MAG TPA: SPOR domain-containing protein [Kofleriaceae bacterium]|jgi:cell division septation protein DedD|nr:SPOR domain-containing protein [Kofleriaceae bacterium]